MREIKSVISLLSIHSQAFPSLFAFLVSDKAIGLTNIITSLVALARVNTINLFRSHHHPIFVAVGPKKLLVTLDFLSLQAILNLKPYSTVQNLLLLSLG